MTLRHTAIPNSLAGKVCDLEVPPDGGFWHTLTAIRERPKPVEGLKIVNPVLWVLQDYQLESNDYIPIMSFRFVAQFTHSTPTR
jgi:hypothetical protein